MLSLLSFGIESPLSLLSLRDTTAQSYADKALEVQFRLYGLRRQWSITGEIFPIPKGLIEEGNCFVGRT